MFVYSLPLPTPPLVPLRFFFFYYKTDTSDSPLRGNVKACLAALRGVKNFFLVSTDYYLSPPLWGEGERDNHSSP